MRKITLLIIAGGLFITSLSSQNSFNAIKTSKRGGILTTLINPADLAGMPQKFDLNIIGVDMNVSNNTVNLTDIGSTDSLKERLFNKATAEGLSMRVNADIVGPSIAIALNKKTTVGLITRGRIMVAGNRLDVALVKSILDGTIADNVSLPYNSPSINYMNANAFSWAELGAVGATEIYKDKHHSLKIGGTIKVLFSGAYANTYVNNFKFRLYKDAATNKPMIDNASGDLGIEYTGSSDPLKDMSKNIIGGPSGLAFDAGVSYQLRNTKNGNYIVKLGASILDIGSMRYQLDRNNSRLFSINRGPHDPTAVQGNNLDEIINSIKANGIATEIPTDTNIIVNLPMAYNFLADVNIWKPFFVTLNMQRRATNAENARSMQALNYFTITPRIATRFVEIYVPFSFTDVQGTTVGAGLKLGPLYAGSSSLISAMASNENKAVDFHFGLRAGFGKRFK